MQFKRYLDQLPEWPKEGRHIMAQFDGDSIVVYQAYQPSIAQYAVEHQQFGGEFSFNRMSWIKTNFLWMMFRSGWATKEHQERILAIRLPRIFFNELLVNSIPSTMDLEQFKSITSREERRKVLAESEVRLQWDPDHDPLGAKTERRAIQLGLRGSVLERFGKIDLVSITDITEFVVEQREHLVGGDFEKLYTPLEQVYYPGEDAAKLIGLESS